MKRKADFGQDAAISVKEEAISVQSYKSRAFTLTLSTPWIQAHLEIIVCKFGRNRSICLVVKAICAKSFQADRQTTDAAP